MYQTSASYAWVDSKSFLWGIPESAPGEHPLPPFTGAAIGHLSCDPFGPESSGQDVWQVLINPDGFGSGPMGSGVVGHGRSMRLSKSNSSASDSMPYG